MKLACGCRFQFPNFVGKRCAAHVKARKARMRRTAAYVTPNPWAVRAEAEKALQGVTRGLQRIAKDGLPGYAVVGNVIDPDDGDHPSVLFSKPAKGYKRPVVKKGRARQFDPKSREFQVVEL